MGAFSIALVAGGKSTRMGRDKGLLPIAGLPMAAFVLRQVDGLSDDVFIISNNNDYAQFGRPVFPDRIPDIGALEGLYTALSCARYDLCLVLACDMPFINLPLVNRILALSDFHRSDVVIPRLGNPTSTEPFRAAYRKTCQEPIREAIAAGNRRMISFYHQVRVHYIELEEILSYDPRLLSFFNVNTPEDLLEAERLASQEPPGSNLQ